jgi:hypothetical protein
MKKNLSKYRKEVRRKELELEKQTWQLLENGHVIETFSSHTKAKRVFHFKIKEANDDYLDLWYELRRKE